MIFADKLLSIFDYLKNSSHVIRLQPSHWTRECPWIPYRKFSATRA